MLPKSVPAGSRTQFPLRSGVSECSELSDQISQELDFWWVLGGLVPWPGGWWCLAWAASTAAFLGTGSQKSKKWPYVFELGFEIWRHPDTTCLFFPNFQCKTGTPCWPRTAAEPGLSQG
eukprot:gene14373-biopygen18629